MDGDSDDDEKLDDLLPLMETFAAACIGESDGGSGMDEVFTAVAGVGELDSAGTDGATYIAVGTEVGAVL